MSCLTHGLHSLPLDLYQLNQDGGLHLRSRHEPHVSRCLGEGLTLIVGGPGSDYDVLNLETRDIT